MGFTIYDEESRIWSGPKKELLYNQNISVGQVLLTALERYPDKVGQISANNGREFTNKEIHLLAVRAFQNLKNLGYKQTDVFGFVTKNTHFLAPVVIASFTLGAKVHPIDPSYKSYEIITIFQKTNPNLIFCDHDNVKTVKEAVKELRTSAAIFVFGETTTESISNAEELFNETGQEKNFIPPIIGDGTKEIAAIMCSSGTTGISKGICLSHALINDKADFLMACTNDVVLTFSSLFWVSGLTTFYNGIVSGALRIITTERFRPDLMIELIDKYKVSCMMIPPSSLALTVDLLDAMKHDLQSLRFFLNGGGSIAESICEGMNKHLPNGTVYLTYGLTEILGIVATNSTGSNYKSVGKLAMNVQVKILDTTTGCKNGVGKEGEICVRPPYILLGYCNEENLYKMIIDEDGFVHTGDVGYFDDDGYLYLVDRKKDIFKYQNSHISPTEIEKIISVIDGIQLVCVVGIPDPICGGLPAAVLKVDNKSNRQVLKETVRKAIEDKLSDAKQLRGGIYFIDSFPLTGSGKIVRRQVQEFATTMYENRGGN